MILACSLVNAYSAANNVIPYCIDPNWLPYEAIEGNQHIGLSSDYIKILQNTTEYDFKLVITKDWQQSLAYIKSGECLLLPMLNQTPERSEFIDFSTVYFTSPNFLVSTQDQPFLQSFENIGQRTLAVTEGYRITEYIAKNHPAINTRVFASEAEGLTAVSEGEVDLFIGSVHSVNNQIQTLGLSNLKLAGWGGPDDELRMGVVRGQNALLNKINQALANITQQQHFEIYNRWNDVKVIDNTNYKLIWQISLGSLFVLLLLLVRYFSMRNYNQILTTKNRQLSELQNKLIQSNSDLHNISQHDALTGLYNRHHFNQLIAEDLQNNSSDKGPLSLIFVDIDFFKSINDNHGHVVGDQVLKAFGKLLKTCCDEGELVSRWGGEEFVILKQPATYQDAEKLCAKIRDQMQGHTFAHQQPLTCSFGIAQMTADESLMDCFERADKMLYQAKELGRNRVCVAN